MSSALPPPLPESSSPSRPGVVSPGENPFEPEPPEPPPLPEPGEDDDIEAERALYESLRYEPGLFKPRGKAPNLLVTAWRTPGELAVMALSVFFYIIGLALLVILGGETVRRMPGIFQCVLLGLLVIPAFMAGGRAWRAMGRRAREAVRWGIRLWPVSLPVLLLATGVVARLLRG